MKNLLIIIILLMAGICSFGQDAKPVDANNKALQAPNNPTWYYNTVTHKIGLWKGGTYLWNTFFSAVQVQAKIDSINAHGGKIRYITGTLPITVTETGVDSVDVAINAATPTTAGSLSAADKAKLDSLQHASEPLFYTTDSSTYTANVEYGYLYNWYATANIAGSGWHVPTQTELNALQTELGGTTIAGGHLKESGLTHWITPNTGADNSSNFNGRGSGHRKYDNGVFSQFGLNSYYWSSTLYNPDYAYSGILAYTNASFTVNTNANPIKYGFSIRLIKDDSTLPSYYQGNDGKRYGVVQIGTQIWMSENLMETLYADGSAIPEVTVDATWAGLTTGARCSYNNNEANAGTATVIATSVFLGDQISHLASVAQTADSLANVRANFIPKIASSTDNAVTRWDGVTGRLIQNSTATLNDSTNFNIPTGSKYEINGKSIVGDEIVDGVTTRAASQNKVFDADAAKLDTTKATVVMRSHWDNGYAAYLWGNHASAGYLTSLSGAVLTDQSTPQTVGATGARVFKFWSTDIETTNMPTVGGTSLATTFAPASVYPATGLTGNYLVKKGATVVVNSQIYDNGTNVGIGTTGPLGGLDIKNGIIADIKGTDVTQPFIGFGSYWNGTVVRAQGTTTYGMGIENVRTGLGATSLLNFNSYTSTDVYRNVMSLTAAGNVGIGTIVPINIISLGSEAARTIWMERRNTTNNAGNNLTVQAGGTTNGMVSTVNLTGANAGTGYSPNNVLTLATPTGGTAATITVATIAATGGLKTLAIVAGGTGYTPGTVVLTVVQAGASLGTISCTADVGGIITSINSVVTIGSGYSVATPLATTGGGNNDCTINLQAISGAIATLTVTTKGAKYTTGVKTTTVAPVGGTAATINVATIESATNKAGGNLILASGLGSGSGAASTVIVQTSPTSGTGATDNTLVTRATFGGAETLALGSSSTLSFLGATSGKVILKASDVAGTPTQTFGTSTGQIALVSQAITDGVLDKSPSEDAIFHALAGKQAAMTDIAMKSDWNRTDTTTIGWIRNKPTIPSTTLFTTVALSDEATDLVAGTSIRTFRMPVACTVTAVRLSCNTAPTGSTIIVDINESGTTILSTKLSIDASEKTSTTAASAAAISDSSIADDAEMTVDIDQIGSTISGKGLKLIIYYNR